jgi:hypothetical protein
MYGGFRKSIISVHQHMDIRLGLSDMFFSTTTYSRILSRPDGNEVCGMFFGEEGYGRINSGTRVLELAADSWKAALGHGAR